MSRNIAPFRGGDSGPSNSWFLGPTRVHTPKGISTGSVALAQLTVVTNRHTDHATSVTTGRASMHRVHAMRYNNHIKLLTAALATTFVGEKSTEEMRSHRYTVQLYASGPHLIFHDQVSQYRPVGPSPQVSGLIHTNCGGTKGTCRL